MSTDVDVDFGGGYTAYSSPQLDTDYMSNSTRVPTFLDNSGYIFTDWFVGKVTQGPFLPQDILETFDLDDIDVFVDELLSNWGTVMTYNWRIAVCVIFGFVMTLLVPIMGIVWCHKHRRGKWGGDKHGHPDVYHKDWSSSVKRQTVFTLFGLFCAVSVWGIIWHFMADELMSRGMRTLPENIDYIVQDTYTYLNNSVAQADHWRDVNLEVELLQNYEASLNEAKDTMEAVKNDIDTTWLHFDRVEEIPVLLYNVSLDFVDHDQDELVYNLKVYISAVDIIEQETLNFTTDPVWDTIMDGCAGDCGEIWTLLNQTFVNQTLIPNVTAIENIVINQTDFDNMVRFKSDSAVVRHELDVLGGPFVEQNLDLYNAVLDDMKTYFHESTEEFYEVMYTMLFEDPEVDESISEQWDKWFEVAYYTFMIPGMILCVVLLLYFIGFFVGIFSHVESENRVHAARLTAGGTAMFYILALLLWFVTSLLFISGVAFQELGCQTFEDPANSDLYVMFEEDINEELRDAFANVTDGFANTSWVIPEMLERCESDDSLYVILHVDDVYDVKSLRTWRSEANTAEVGQILSDSLNDTLDDVMSKLVFEDEELMDYMLDYQQRMYPIVEYTHQILYVDVDAVIDSNNIDELNNLLEEMSKDPANAAIRADIEMAQKLCHSYNGSMNAFQYQNAIFRNYTVAYMNRMVYAYQTVYERIDDVFANIFRAQYILPNIDYFLFDALAEEYEDSLNTVDGFAEYSVVLLEEELGRCLPFYDIYLAGINYSCYEIVDPINNIWAALGLILLCFVPILFCAVFVEKIFRAVKPEQTLFMLDMKQYEDEDFKILSDVKPYYFEADQEFARYTKKFPPRPSLVPRASLVPKAEFDPNKIHYGAHGGLGLPPVVEGKLLSQQMSMVGMSEYAEVTVHTSSSSSSSPVETGSTKTAESDDHRLEFNRNSHETTSTSSSTSSE